MHGEGKTILSKFNLRIQRGDRIGIVGRNGSGKTTFLKLLVGELPPDGGTVKRAKDLALSYFDQKRKDLNPENSLQRTLCPNGSDYIDVMGKTRHVCGYLKDFLFDPRMAQAPVSTLSGGQKNRLMLAKILANPGNLLILDEPTNDLDMDTLDMLEDMLANYKGTLLVVSHDRDFLDQTVSRILAFEGGGKIEGYIGGYQDYLAARKKKIDSEKIETRHSRLVSEHRAGSSGNLVASDSERMSLVPRGRAAKDSGFRRNDDSLSRMTYKQKYELETLPARIGELEREINDIELQLADPDLYAKDASGFQRYSTRLVAARHELGVSEARWLELEELRLSFEASNL
jgi:ABC transport system ATP-binding/permease protein